MLTVVFQGGFLDEIYPSAYVPPYLFMLKAGCYHPPSAKAIWDFEGIYCTSRHIPHVKFAGLIHPGILGCAPSAEVLDTWNTREGELIAANKLDRDVALPWVPLGNVHDRECVTDSCWNITAPSRSASTPAAPTRS